MCVKRDIPCFEGNNKGLTQITHGDLVTLGRRGSEENVNGFQIHVHGCVVPISNKERK